MKVCELIALLQTCIRDFELKEIIFTKDKNGEYGVDIIYDNEAMFGQKTELPMNNINNEKEKNNS